MIVMMTMPSDVRRLLVGSRMINRGRGMREMRGERMKRERERGEGVEEESEGSIPTSFQKRLGCESEKVEKSDLVRLLYLPFSYSTTPAVPHMRCRKNSLLKKK